MDQYYIPVFELYTFLGKMGIMDANIVADLCDMKQSY